MQESWIFENGHFKSVTKYARFFEFSRFCPYKRSIQAYFVAKYAIEKQKGVIREQKVRKIRKSNPDHRK